MHRREPFGRRRLSLALILAALFALLAACAGEGTAAPADDDENPPRTSADQSTQPLSPQTPGQATGNADPGNQGGTADTAPGNPAPGNPAPGNTDPGNTTATTEPGLNNPNNTTATTEPGLNNPNNTTATTEPGLNNPGNDNPGDATPRTTVAPPPPPADAPIPAGVLTVWADEILAEGLVQASSDIAEQSGRRIQVVAQPRGDLARTFLSDPGNRPDLIVVPHTMVAELADEVVDVDPARLAGIAPGPANAALHQGRTLGLPLSVDGVGLVRNTALVPNAPATWAELEATALGLREGDTAPLAIQQAPPGAFHNYPLYSAISGREAFERGADGRFDPQQPTLDSPDGLRAADAFASWLESGLIDRDMTYDGVINAVNSGQTPFAVVGSSAFFDNGWGLDLNRLPLAVSPLPAADGDPAQPFITVDLALVSAGSSDPAGAQAVLGALANPSVQAAVASVSQRPAAHTGAGELSGDLLGGLGRAVATGVPVPTVDEMGPAWEIWAIAYDRILNGDDARAAFTDAAEAMRSALLD